MKKLILSVSLCALALITLVAVSKNNTENTSPLTADFIEGDTGCLLYTSPSPRD